MSIPAPPARHASRLAFGVCVALSLGLHALLLGLWPRQAALQGAAATPSAPTVLQARLFRPAPPQAAPVEAPPLIAATPPDPAASMQRTAARTARHGAQARTQGATAPAPTTIESSAAPRAAPEATPTGDPEGYVPRPLLSVPPILQTQVVIAAPPAAAQVIGIRTAILALFIDDEGQVREVHSQEPRLPPEYEQAAREAFLAARYAPGRINGRAVKSRIRVEVRFGGAAALP